MSPHAVWYDADEYYFAWMPTLRAMWSPKGQQAMVPTPGQPTQHDGLGAVNAHPGETVVLFRGHIRRQEIAERLHALLENHLEETISGACDHATTHEAADVDAVVQSAVGRLVVRYLPTYSPWLNPIEMRWRHCRREVTHCGLVESVKALLAAAPECFARYNRELHRLLSIIGAIPKN